jgi:hypothetical protein
MKITLKDKNTEEVVSVIEGDIVKVIGTDILNENGQGIRGYDSDNLEYVIEEVPASVQALKDASEFSTFKTAMLDYLGVK